MQSLLIPTQESCFLLRILNISFQSIDSLKDCIALHFTPFSACKRGLELINFRSKNTDQNVTKEIPDGEGEPRVAVFNALDAMLKDNLDRLKSMRENMSGAHTHSNDAISETNCRIDANSIRGLCLEGKVGDALQPWRTMVKKFRVSDVLTRNYLLNAFCKSGDLERAEWLVEEMKLHGPSPTCATYNTLMKGYCLVNRVDKALDVFSDMTKYGIQPNKISCNILVHALRENGVMEAAIALLEKILAEDQKGRTLGLITSTILMDGYFKTGKMVEALSYWNDVVGRSMDVDVIAYNVVIHGHCLSGNINLAYKCLCEMLKIGHLPDTYTYNTIISLLCKSGKINEACYIFDAMLRMGVPPDQITYKMIVQGLCINDDVVRAGHFLSHMLASSFIPEPLVWNVVIDAYGRRGDLLSALYVKDQMIAYGVLPNVYTYNALIRSEIKIGNIDQAYYLQKEMLRKGIFPDLVTYNLLIGAASSLGHIAYAVKFHDEMQVRGCKPDIITYTELLKCYCMRNKLKDAEELFCRLLHAEKTEGGVTIDHVLFLILMKKLFKIGELDKVFDLYQLWLSRNSAMVR